MKIECPNRLIKKVRFFLRVDRVRGSVAAPVPRRFHQETGINEVLFDGLQFRFGVGSRFALCLFAHLLHEGGIDRGSIVSPAGTDV